MANHYKYGGRYNHEKNDCTVIAMAYALNLEYRHAHSICSTHGRQDCKGFYLWKALTRNPLTSKFGHMLEFRARPRMSLATFQQKNPTGRFIIVVGHHAFAMIDGQILNQSNMGQRVKYYWKVTKLTATESKVNDAAIVEKPYVASFANNEKVVFTPHRHDKEVTGVICDCFLNKEGKEYVKIIRNDTDTIVLKRSNQVKSLMKMAAST